MKPLIELTASIIDDDYVIYFNLLTSCSKFLLGCRLSCDNILDDFDVRVGDNILIGVAGIVFFSFITA